MNTRILVRIILTALTLFVIPVNSLSETLKLGDWNRYPDYDPYTDGEWRFFHLESVTKMAYYSIIPPTFPSTDGFAMEMRKYANGTTGTPIYVPTYYDDPWYDYGCQMVTQYHYDSIDYGIDSGNGIFYDSYENVNDLSDETFKVEGTFCGVMSDQGAATGTATLNLNLSYWEENLLPSQTTNGWSNTSKTLTWDGTSSKSDAISRSSFYLASMNATAYMY